MVRRDVRMLHDPMRVQFRSMLTGLVLAVMTTAGCAVLAYLHPAGQLGSAKIVMSAESGALYVVVDNTLHPALNLASARLITGSDEIPTAVADAKLADLPRGPLLGIPGAPAMLPAAADPDRSAWTLCDDTTAALHTTVVDGPPAPSPQLRAITPDQAVLAAQGDSTYLIYNGRHARLAMTDNAVVSTLQLRGVHPRPIGTGLLDATPAAPDLVSPVVPDAGTPSALHGGAIPVGSVVRVAGVDRSTLYLVLTDGIQEISEFTAELLRTGNSMGSTTIPELSPDAINGIPVRHSLPLDQFPATRPEFVPAATDPVACVTWSRGAHDPAATLQVLTGTQLPLAQGRKPMALVDAGTPPGSRADSAYLPAATGEFVQATGIEPDSTRRDGLFFVTDTGVRFGIPDLATAKILGLNDPKPVPWQIIEQLPAGPMLDRQSALVARDTVGDNVIQPGPGVPPGPAQ